MYRSKIFRNAAIALSVFVVLIVVIHKQQGFYLPTKLIIEVQSGADTYQQVYYDSGYGYNEAESIRLPLKGSDAFEIMSFSLPGIKINKIRIDPSEKPGNILIRKICISNILRDRCRTGQDLSREYKPLHNISEFDAGNGLLSIISTGEDPYFEFKGDFPRERIYVTSLFLYSVAFLFSLALFFFAGAVEKLLIRSMHFADNLLKNKLFRYFIAFLPIGIFFWTIFRYGVNIPNWDDYDSLLRDVLNFLDLKNLQDKITLIFSQQNEHRIAFIRIITLSDYYLNGSINFKRLILIGNISLIGLTLVLFKAFKREDDKFFYFIPVIYFLFQPQYWESIFWAIASLANLWVLFFVFLSIYLATESSARNLLLAVFFAVLATFTSGNGMFVFIVVLPILIYQKRFLHGLIWSVITVITFFFYFHGYITPAYHPSIWNAIFRQPVNTVNYLFSFVGSSVSSSSFLPRLMGLLPFVAFIYLTKQKYYEKNLKVYSFLIFLFITSIVVSLARSGFGVEQAFASRYKIISILFFIVLYMALIETPDKERWLKRYFPIILALAIIFNFVSYYTNYNAITWYRTHLLSGLLTWQANMDGLSYPDPVKANDILTTSIQRNIYSVPRNDFQEILSERREFSLPHETNYINYSFEPKENNFLVAIEDGWAYINGQSSENTEIYIILKSDKETYIFDTIKHKRPDVTAFFKTLNFDDSGFVVFILKKGLERGVYTIGLYVRKNNIGELQYTNKLVTVS